VLCINAVDASATISIKQTSQVGAGASVKWQQVTLGGKDIAHDLLSRVVGANGTSAVDWMLYGKGSEKQAINVRNIFDAANGGGEVLMQGVAEGTANVSAKGLIDIGLKGGGTNTYLTQRVLMLDRTAKVHAVPSLEIKTNDVKASHSATVARVTEEDLFYFGARGISPREARAMYVQGFLGDITARIASIETREKVMEMIEKKYAAA
jgi:Fe-S cluster assembly protein SufB/Fe-S cluster assembly protein SufD